MYTVKQLAALAGVSASLIYGWCETGQLPHVRLGAAGRRGKIMIAEADWVAFLAARRVEGLVPRPVTRAGAPRPFKHVKLRPPAG